MPILVTTLLSSLALLEREKRRWASGQEAWLPMALLRLITSKEGRSNSRERALGTLSNILHILSMGTPKLHSPPTLPLTLKISCFSYTSNGSVKCVVSLPYLFPELGMLSP